MFPVVVRYIGPMNKHLEHGKSAVADFDPANYTYVSTGYNGEVRSDEFADYISGIYDEETAALQHEAIAQKPFSGLYGIGQGGKCRHCGANIKWYSLFRDVRTGLLVATGTTCANELGLPDKGALVRKALAERIARATKLAKLDLEHPGLRQELERVVLADRPDRAYFFSFLQDLLHKVNRYFEISEKQAECAKRFLGQGLDRIAEREAKKAAEPQAQPIPAKYLGERVVIKGVVLGVKEIESDEWGLSYKMLVQSVEGFKVWGKQLANKGEIVEFCARIEVSKDDPCFGFFSRPTKSRVIEAAEAVAL